MNVDAEQAFGKFDEVARTPEMVTLVDIDEVEEVGDIWTQDIERTLYYASVGCSLGSDEDFLFPPYARLERPAAFPARVDEWPAAGFIDIELRCSS
ncbi:hypothetical protein [Rhizobium johnstonii]|uniref:hypothetical protein n=1 Tax=Rhizobium johnstonii TaxID=3019933 RepID=UPI003F9D3796